MAKKPNPFLKAKEKMAAEKGAKGAKGGKAPAGKGAAKGGGGKACK